MNILSGLKKFALSAAGLFGFGNEADLEKDIETIVNAPTEANIDAAISDSGKVALDFFHNLKPEVIAGFQAIGYALTATFKDPSVHNAEVAAAEIVHQLPVINPNFQITQEHGDALVKAITDVLSDLKIK